MLSPDITGAPAGSLGPLGLPSIFLAIPLSSRNFVRRILALAIIFLVEVIVLSLWLDGASLVQRAGLVGIMYDWGAWILRCAVGFPVIFLTFAYLRNKALLARISGQIERIPVRWGNFAAHCVAMGLFVVLSALLYGKVGPGPWDNLLAASWFLAGILGIAFAGFTFLPWTIWAQLISGTGYLFGYATAAVVLACFSGNIVRQLWQPVSYVTLYLSKIFLSLFISGVFANPHTMSIGTQRFNVEIAPQCSGLEGIGLILVFAILWLLIFRKECQFPRSLVLIPFGITLIFLLNSVRIAALVLLGNAGAEQIALGGFHSQAGWIAFSAVGVGFCFVVQRFPWFTTGQNSWESFDTATRNLTAGSLLPLIMILVMGMVATAAKGPGGVEWLYPLRFLGAVSMFWVFRRSYANLNWRCDWLAPVIGVAVFVIWLTLDQSSNRAADHEFSAALLGHSTTARVTWITFRVLAAVVTVPLAEELAFRCFLMRRLISPDFQLVPFRRLSWFALLVSSVTFGFLHGAYWSAGTIAGVLFGLAVVRRGRMGDALVAHATANALLALYVLEYHQWHLW
jgi:exosortase E/protease (VPEID-CTERM system)